MQGGVGQSLGEMRHCGDGASLRDAWVCVGTHLYPTLRCAYVGLLRAHLSEMQDGLSTAGDTYARQCRTEPRRGSRSIAPHKQRSCAMWGDGHPGSPASRRDATMKARAHLPEMQGWGVLPPASGYYLPIPFVSPSYPPRIPFVFGSWKHGAYTELIRSKHGADTEQTRRG